MATAGEAKRGLERAFFAVPEVSWHGHEEIKAIMTVDVNLDGLVATGSIDNEIRVRAIPPHGERPHAVPASALNPCSRPLTTCACADMEAQ